MDRILRRSLGVSETAQADATVKPAPPVASEPLTEEEYDFDTSHMDLDIEALGLKVGEPKLVDDDEPEGKVKWNFDETDGDSESAQKPIGHDEL